MADNGTIIQYFEWYLPSDKQLWKQLTEHADELSSTGITAVWTPPAYKGASGAEDVGYGVYDIYDLGEFEQKGTAATKYGTRDEYIGAVRELHKNNVQVYADIVLNHMMGADETEMVEAEEVCPSDRNRVTSGVEKIEAWTVFNFPGRNNVYSDFHWNHTHFDGIDWDQGAKRSSLFLFDGKTWEQEVDKENANFDYLMGADIDFKNQEVIEHLTQWGQWFINTTDVDGVRLDAVKHIAGEFYRYWLPKMRELTGKELFAVGEYWNGSKSTLENYLSEVVGDMSLFDVPLHFNFYNASCQYEKYDMRQLFDNSLVGENPIKTVTFVDNHDTQPGQALASYVNRWFKPIAYALILLRSQGYPCVFYGDYYGIPHDDIQPVSQLKVLINVRKNYAYGEQLDYFDDSHIVGFTRQGDSEHKNSGVAVLLSNSGNGEKRMFVGNDKIGRTYIDIINPNKPFVAIENDGCGRFTVSDKYISVYILQQ
ncbi:MAG TPA: alpha-amylase [Clostridiales bacterium]|nr:alpha-amylase [Clostridiales bacterium]